MNKIAFFFFTKKSKCLIFHFYFNNVGRCHIGKGSTFDSNEGTAELFGGSAWVHCALQTAMKLKSLIDEQQFAQIELSMHGTTGWYYRVSCLYISYIF